ncbi:MAG TPA: hypothetical protein VJK02_23395 [Anaerolineales bacterium]|nr:hypothetical protein [Anaerolineales bacterium]
MIRRSSSLWLLLALALVFAVGLLTSHRIPDGYLPRPCADNFRVYGDLTIVLNCDSPEFMRLALQPDEIFEPENTRQSRPGLILLAATLSTPFEPIADLAERFFTLQGRSLQEWTIEFLPAYIAYGVLNFAILAISLVLFVRLLPAGPEIPLAATLTGVVLVSNDVAKMFLLTPHTALLAILVPLFCLWSYKVAAIEGRAQTAKILVLSLAAGLGVTAYAAFIVFLPCIAIPRVVRLIRAFSARRLASFSLLLVLAVSLVVLPMVAWIVAVEGEAGEFYSEELQGYGQVVWMRTALQRGVFPLLQGLLSNSLMIVGQDLLYLGFLAIFVAVVVREVGWRLSDLRAAFRSVGVEPIIVACLFVGFFAAIGLAADRVAFTAVPPLVVGSAIVVAAAVQPAAVSAKRIAGLAAVILAVVFLVLQLAKTGPFS